MIRFTALLFLFSKLFVAVALIFFIAITVIVIAGIVITIQCHSFVIVAIILGESIVAFKRISFKGIRVTSRRLLALLFRPTRRLGGYRNRCKRKDNRGRRRGGRNRGATHRSCGGSASSG